jgi:hypothetical protein
VTECGLDTGRWGRDPWRTLVDTVITFRFHKIRGFSWLADRTISSSRRTAAPWRLLVVVHSFPYEAWPSLGHKTANHNGGVGTAFSRLAAVRDICIGAVQCCHVHRLAIASLAWTTSLGWKIYLATLVSSALNHVTKPKPAEKHTNAVGPPHTTQTVA